jgi:hypothetical protein
MEEKVILNEKEISLEEFKKEKENLEKKPGVRIVEVKPGVFKTLIQG